MTIRAFVEDITSSVIRIDDSEAHHLLNVMRLKVGDDVELFDGAGNAATGCITSVSRRHADVAIHRRISPIDSARTRLNVAAAPAKGDRLKWMVEKLTEIGVDRLTLLKTDRTIVSPGEAKQEKLRTNVIAACKQCGRNRLMDLQMLSSLSSVLDESRKANSQVLIAHPSMLSPGTIIVPQSVELHSTATLLVGPEGGFTETEVDMAVQNGARVISWPATILRIETAAVVLAAVVMSHRRDAS